MGIGLFVHRIYQCKHSTTALLTISCSKTAVMQFCQTACIVQADTCSPVHNSLSLIIQLVIAFKDILALLFRYSLTCICNTHLYLIIYYIQLHINPTPTWCELKGIRQQIGYYLLQFITICPCHQLVFHAESVQCKSFLLSIKLKGVADVVHHLYHIYLFYTQAQGIVLQFIKVHQLVYQFEHSLNAALGNIKQTTLFAINRAALS